MSNRQKEHKPTGTSSLLAKEITFAVAGIHSLPDMQSVCYWLCMFSHNQSFSLVSLERLQEEKESLSNLISLTRNQLHSPKIVQFHLRGSGKKKMKKGSKYRTCPT